MDSNEIIRLRQQLAAERRTNEQLRKALSEDTPTLWDTIKRWLRINA